MSSKGKRKKVKQCFSLSRDFVKQLDDLSDKTGVPMSRIIENCFGDSDRLADFEKFCSSVKKRRKEEK